MALQIKLTIGDSQDFRPAVDDRFLRRDYSFSKSFDLSLSAGRKTDLLTSAAEESLIYIKVKSGGPVQVYKDLSPEYWTFSNTWLMFEMSDISRIALKALVDTEVFVFIARE